MSQPEFSKRQLYWLWKTKRLFPHPLFAGCISLACLLIGILFAGVAINVAGCWPMGIPSVLFFAASYVTAVAAITKPNNEGSEVEQNSGHVQTNKPTRAILVLLIGVYSWLLTLAMHVFEVFFKNGPGSAKYYITLGIAITSTLFMQLYGKRVVAQHFGNRGGRNLELTASQALYVVFFVVCFGIYGVWLVSWYKHMAVRSVRAAIAKRTICVMVGFALLHSPYELRPSVSVLVF